MDGSVNPLIGLAKRAAAGNWDDERAGAEMTVTFGVEGLPDNFTDWITALMDPQLPAEVADWAARLASQLAAERSSSRGQGLIASLLATAYLMRGQFGEEGAQRRAQQYIAAADELLPPDEPSRFGLTMMQALMGGEAPISLFDQLPTTVQQSGMGRVMSVLKEASSVEDPEEFIAGNFDQDMRDTVEQAKSMLVESGAMRAAAEMSRFAALVDRAQDRPGDEPDHSREVMERLVDAQDATDLDAIADEFPIIYNPGLVTLIDRFIDAGRAADAPKLVNMFEQRLVWLDQLRARHPLDLALLAFVEQTGPAEERPAALESSLLHDWTAAARLAAWTERARARGDKVTTDLFEHELCELGRWLYAKRRVTNLQPAATWTKPLRRYMLDREHDYVLEAVAHAEEDAPAEVVEVLRAYEQMDTDAVARHAGPAEAVLWSQRRAEDAMLIATLLVDVVIYAAELLGHYTVQQQKEIIEACLVAAEIGAKLSLQRSDGILASMYLGAKGNAQLHIHHIDDALDSFERANKILESLRGSSDYDPRLEIATINNIGNVFNGRQDYKRAEDQFRRAVNLARKSAEATPGVYLGELADTLMNHASVLSRLHRLNEVVAEQREAITIYRSLAQQKPEAYRGRLATALSNFAAMLEHVGQVAEAEVLSEEALDIQGQLVQAVASTADQGYSSLGVGKESNEAVQATILANRAAEHFRKRELKQASDLLARSEVLFTGLAKSYPEVYLPRLAMTLGNRASVLAALDDFEAAEQSDTRALEIYRRLIKARPGQFESGLASTLTNVGSTRLEMRLPEQAIVALEEAVTIRRSLVKTQSTAFNPLLALSLAMLGNAYLSAGRFDRAVETFDEAIKLDPNDLEDGGWRALVGLSRLTRARGDTRQARDLLEQALLKTEGMRVRLHAPEDRRSFQTDVAQAYLRMVDLCLELDLEQHETEQQPGETGPSEEHSGYWVEQAWHWAQRAKGRTLLELLGENQRPRLETEAQQQAYGDWNQLIVEIEELNNRSRLRSHTGMALSELVAWREQLVRLQEREKIARRRLVSLLNENRQLPQAELPPAAELAMLLRKLSLRQHDQGDNERRPLLVDFFMPDRDRYAVFLLPLWRVKPGQPLPLKVYQIDLPGRLSGVIDDFLFAMLSVKTGMVRPTEGDWLPAPQYADNWDSWQAASQAQETFATLPEMLGETLLRPWANHLEEENPTEIILIPHRLLHLLPIHIAAFADGRPLIRRYPVVYLPNAGIARPLDERRRDDAAAPQGRLVLGPPITDDAHPQFLPAAIEEAAELAVKWGLMQAPADGNSRAQPPFSGKKMRVELLQNQGGKLLVAHLTTHSTFNVDDYLQSQIMFGGKPLTLFDLLTNPAYDFSGMRLFYLSSCESGMARTEAGDELQGLVWALVTAGANAVMATLWSALDTASCLVSRAFYEAWQAGGTLAEAHATALRQLAEDTRFSNSFFWAPFVLFGDGWSAEGNIL